MNPLDRDYKHLANRHRARTEDSNTGAGDADYLAHPAWRNQWFAMLSLVALIAVGASVALRGTGKMEPLYLQAAIAGFAVAFLWLLLVVLYRHYAWTYSIRNGNIESQRGIIGRDVQSIRIEDLRNVNVRQSIVQRIFKVGDVEFSSAGGAGIEVAFRGVPNPLAVKAQVYRHGRSHD